MSGSGEHGDEVFHKMPLIARPAEELLACQAELWSMEFVIL